MHNNAFDPKEGEEEETGAGNEAEEESTEVE